MASSRIPIQFPLTQINNPLDSFLVWLLVFPFVISHSIDLQFLLFTLTVAYAICFSSFLHIYLPKPLHIHTLLFIVKSCIVLHVYICQFNCFSMLDIYQIILYEYFCSMVFSYHFMLMGTVFKVSSERFVLRYDCCCGTLSSGTTCLVPSQNQSSVVTLTRMTPTHFPLRRAQRPMRQHTRQLSHECHTAQKESGLKACIWPLPSFSCPCSC